MVEWDEQHVLEARNSQAKETQGSNQRKILSASGACIGAKETIRLIVSFSLVASGQPRDFCETFEIDSHDSTGLFEGLPHAPF